MIRPFGSRDLWVPSSPQALIDLWSFGGFRVKAWGTCFRDRPNKHVVTLVDSLPQFNESTEVEDEVEDKQDLVYVDKRP
ncbi:hypothetical protein E3N88_24227 [Mikania micrantha]|uniref:Uncharacterized protein n=1 Tax=Mikania micrantha TaxID=192012 RepID=A0A5N6NFF9_9ASTR|nr:hypothetical protein E3N88_24227 [Mikania micrantha]